MGKVHSIEVTFPTAVELPPGFEQRLTELVDEACRRYEAEHRDLVMWLAGFGQKITYMPMTAEEEAAGKHMEFDEGCFSIEVAERPRFDTEPYMPGDRAWQGAVLATVGWGSFVLREIGTAGGRRTPMSHWPQFIWIALVLTDLFLTIMRDGQVRPKRENAFTSLISAGVLNAVLYAGGFYDGLLP